MWRFKLREFWLDVILIFFGLLTLIAGVMILVWLMVVGFWWISATVLLFGLAMGFAGAARSGY